MEIFRVLDPGPYTTVQDSGRYGFQRFGIPVSGVLDKFAYRVANMLVGNPENSAALEMTFVGPRLEVLSDAVIAVTGADMPLFVNDGRRPLWQSVAVKRGDRINFRPAVKGLRAYLAVTGGILVPEIMKSRATSLIAKIGGVQGRPIAHGDIIKRNQSEPFFTSRVVPEEFRPRLAADITLRVIPGPQEDYFDKGLDLFFKSQYHVSPRADRMGYRLEGPAIPFKEGAPTSIISDGSMPGVVQIPPDGLPIIILVEQTAGGYAKIATVISTDLDMVAQARPGDTIRFRPCDLTEAHGTYIDYHDKLRAIAAIMGG